MLPAFKTLLTALVAAALAVAGFLTWMAINGMSQLATQADKVYVAKDVTADILPPPLYLIEARLVASQALDGYIDAATLRREVERLASEYKARVAHWQAARAGEIAAASRAQASSVGQIERAITDIDRTTQETAARYRTRQRNGAALPAAA